MSRNLRIISLLLMVSIAISLFCGCNLLSREETLKEYSSNGVKITLPDNFEQKSEEQFNCYFEGRRAIVSGNKVSYAEFESLGFEDVSNSSVLKMTEFMVSFAGKSGAVKSSADERYSYFTYEETVDGNNFYYTTFLFKSEKNVWMFDMFCFKADKDKYAEKFISWADSIVIEE